MTAIRDAAAGFLAHKRVAVTGVSRTPANHGSNVVYTRLRERGYQVFAVNPNAETVEGDPAYHDLRSIPGGVQAVVIGTRPETAEATVRERRARHQGGLDAPRSRRRECVYGSDRLWARARHHGDRRRLPMHVRTDGGSRPQGDARSPHADRQRPEAGLNDLPAKPTTGVVLACQNVHKRFGDLEAVRGVSFEIAEGETYGLLGPNGAGKTTTISIVCGLLEADAGEVVVAGRRMRTRSVGAKAAIGYVPQELAIYPDLSARENLRFFARLYGLSAKQANRRVDEVLAVVGLADRAREQTKNFSGGMQRRLNIGLGLLHRPRLLVLDEPTVGVDPQSRNAILESVEELGREGMAVLYTTHYMEEAERLCDRVGIIDLGVLKAEGTRAELVALVGEHDRVRLDGVGDLEAAAAAASTLPAVCAASVENGGVQLLVEGARNLLPELLQTVARVGVAVDAVEVDEPDLEAVFLHLTGKALRD